MQGRVRAVTYGRVNGSTPDHYRSLAMQMEVLRRHVRCEGWELVAEFADTGSARMADRPGLSRALTEARDGRYEVLLVYALDRLARSVLDAIQILDELERADVRVLSVSDTPHPAGGRPLVFELLAAMAEYERQTARRQRATQRVVGGERCR